MKTNSDTNRNEFDYDAAFLGLNFLEKQVMIAMTATGRTSATLQEICHALFVTGEETDAINNVLISLMEKEQIESLYADRYGVINPENWLYSEGYRQYLLGKRLKPIVKDLTKNKVLNHYSVAISKAVARELNILKRYGMVEGEIGTCITNSVNYCMQNLSVQLVDYKDENRSSH